MLRPSAGGRRDAPGDHVVALRATGAASSAPTVDVRGSMPQEVSDAALATVSSLTRDTRERHAACETAGHGPTQDGQLSASSRGASSHALPIHPAHVPAHHERGRSGDTAEAGARHGRRARKPPSAIPWACPTVRWATASSSGTATPRRTPGTTRAGGTRARTGTSSKATPPGRASTPRPPARSSSPGRSTRGWSSSSPTGMISTRCTAISTTRSRSRWGSRSRGGNCWGRCWRARTAARRATSTSSCARSSPRRRSTAMRPATTSAVVSSAHRDQATGQWTPRSTPRRWAGATRPTSSTAAPGRRDRRRPARKSSWPRRRQVSWRSGRRRRRKEARAAGRPHAQPRRPSGPPLRRGRRGSKRRDERRGLPPLVPDRARGREPGVGAGRCPLRAGNRRGWTAIGGLVCALSGRIGDRMTRPGVIRPVSRPWASRGTVRVGRAAPARGTHPAPVLPPSFSQQLSTPAQAVTNTEPPQSSVTGMVWLSPRLVMEPMHRGKAGLVQSAFAEQGLLQSNVSEFVHRVLPSTRL